MSKKILNKNLKRHKTSVTQCLLYSANTAEVFDVKKTLWLYRFVYGSRLSLSVVLLLLISFSTQSIERVYANEEVVIESISLDESLSPETLEELEPVIEVYSLPEIPPEENPIAESLLNDNSPDTTAQNSENPVAINEESTSVVKINAESFEPSFEEIPAEADVVVSDTTDYQNEELPENVLEDVVISGETTTETDGQNSEANETIEFIPDERIATTTEEIVEKLPITHETISVTQSDSEFSFKKDECTQLATGSFYCLQPQENTLADALFSAPDVDGDMEIYLVRNGEQTQITSNQVDDAAPYYDQNSDTLVWHRLLDDRFQIIAFNPTSKEEMQISRTAENNMEPTRQGNYTVWQRWTDGGWNIILYDGKTEKQITKDNSHNVAPYIHGSLVVWNSRDLNGKKTIRMFDIESQTYVTVEDPDGLSVSNPRMVFVYDSLHPNGDIVTKGYDVLAKKFIDLDSLPRELPEELPASDSTGETRALIQSKPTVKFDAEESIGSTSTPTSAQTLIDENASSTATGLPATLKTEEIAKETILSELSPSVIEIEIEPFLLDGVPI